MGANSRGGGLIRGWGLNRGFTVYVYGKLISYEWAGDLLHKYVYLLFCKLQLLFKMSTCHLRHEYL